MWRREPDQNEELPRQRDLHDKHTRSRPAGAVLTGSQRLSLRSGKMGII